MLNEYKIAITGASGWVGKNLIVSLFEKINKNNFKKNVFLYASKSKSITINSELNNLKIKKISDFYSDSLKNNFNIVFHCAFIVREYIDKLGISNYIKNNDEITNIVLKGIKKTNNCKLILFSSGAAAPYEKLVSNEVLEKDPYGVLKRKDEILFNEHIETQVMRIYALTGRHIRTPHRFAISNFILQAKQNSRIIFKSKRRIVRGYINAKDLADLSILISINKSNFNKYQILNSVSEEIDLLELAQLVSNNFNQIPVFSAIEKDLSDEVYSASPNKMRLISKELNYKLKNIDEQIIDTILGLNNKN